MIAMIPPESSPLSNFRGALNSSSTQGRSSLIVMLDIERDSMVDTIAAVRLEERVANARHHLAARSTRRRT